MSYYFKINDKDFSMYVNALKVSTQHTYEMKTSANGADRITYKYNRKVIDVGIIPLNDEAMRSLLSEVNKFRVSISVRDPETNTLVENIDCIIPSNTVDYYTIQVGKVMYKAFNLQLKEVNYIGEA